MGWGITVPAPLLTAVTIVKFIFWPIGAVAIQERLQFKKKNQTFFKSSFWTSIGTYSGADIITYPTKEILSKIAFFKKAWQTLKVMPYPWTSSS